MRFWFIVAVAPCLSLAAVAGCSKAQGHYEIRGVTIQTFGPSSSGDQSTLSLGLSNCSAGAPADQHYRTQVKESSTSVTITVEGPVWTGSNQAACADSVSVRLAAPLDGRTLIDGVTGDKVPASPTS